MSKNISIFIVLALFSGFAVSGTFKDITDPEYGAIPNDGLDDSVAFAAAIAGGGSVLVPEGEWNLDYTLNIKVQTHLHGVPAQGAGVKYRSVLIFADDVPGIIVHRYDTNADDYGVPYIEEVPTSTGADGSVIENLHIRNRTYARNPVDVGAHGVWMKTRGQLSNLKIERMAGNGVHGVASARSDDPYVRGNANSLQIDNVQTYNNGGHGIFLDGSDANAGSFDALTSYGNTLCGAWDSSFLGNTYNALNVGHNGQCAYGGDNVNARSVYVGAYTEGSPPVELAGRSIVIGGSQDRFTVKGAPYLYAVNGGLRVSSGIMSEQKTDHFHDHKAWIGGNVETGEILSFTSETDRNTWRLQWDKINRTDLYLRFANIYKAFTLTGKETDQTFGTASPKPYQMHQKYLAVGRNPHHSRRITYADQPTVGEEYGKGDRLYYKDSVVPGGHEGLVCVVAGEYGSGAVFKEFGSIEQ